MSTEPFISRMLPHALPPEGGVRVSRARRRWRRFMCVVKCWTRHLEVDLLSGEFAKLIRLQLLTGYRGWLLLYRGWCWWLRLRRRQLRRGRGRLLRGPTRRKRLGHSVSVLRRENLSGRPDAELEGAQGRVRRLHRVHCVREQNTVVLCSRLLVVVVVALEHQGAPGPVADRSEARERERGSAGSDRGAYMGLRKPGGWEVRRDRGGTKQI